MATLRSYLGAFRAIIEGGGGLSRPHLQKDLRQTWRRSFTSSHVAKAWLQQARFRSGRLGPSAAKGMFSDAAQFSRTRQSGSTFTSPLRRMFHSSKSRWSQAAPNAEATQSLSLGQRLKKLSREYGWSAVGVYFALSVLDFPFCFLLVRAVGTDRIAELEEWVMGNVSKVIPQGVKDWWHEYRGALKTAEAKELGDNRISEDIEKAGWGVKEAQEAHKSEASEHSPYPLHGLVERGVANCSTGLATQLALAYAIHKSFIFLRVPLTAAITPKVVKVLRSWGWQIGKRPVKAAKAAKR